MQLSVLASRLPRHDNICNNNNRHFKQSNKYSVQKPPMKSHLGAATWPFTILPRKEGRKKGDCLFSTPKARRRDQIFHRSFPYHVY